MFRNLDVKINLINSRSSLLDFLDDEISDALGYHMRERGVVIRHDEDYERIEGVDDGVIIHLKSGKQIKSEAAVVGRWSHWQYRSAGVGVGWSRGRQSRESVRGTVVFRRRSTIFLR